MMMNDSVKLAHERFEFQFQNGSIKSLNILQSYP